MPKDEFDFEDPMELTGVALLADEDMSEVMAECFIDEFLWMGYNHKQILALFRSPQYLGPHMILEKRGEAFVRDQIAAAFARWGKTITWPGTISAADSPPPPPHREASAPEPEESSHTDPMGAPIPKLCL